MQAEFTLPSWFNAAASPFPEEFAVNSPRPAGHTGIRTGPDRHSVFRSTTTLTSRAPANPAGTTTLGDRGSKAVERDARLAAAISLLRAFATIVLSASNKPS